MLCRGLSAVLQRGRNIAPELWKGLGCVYNDCLLITTSATELRIHDYTERGDNDTVKKGGKGMGAEFMGGCCGGGAATSL